MNLLISNMLLLALIIGFEIFLEWIVDTFIYQDQSRNVDSEHYIIGKIILVLTFPLVCAMALPVFIQVPLLISFVIFGIIGAFLEWLIGTLYVNMVGETLWEYRSYSIYQYTSWISVPLFGTIALIFMIAGRII